MTKNAFEVMRLNAKLAIDARDRLGEGPVWDATGQRLLWSDNDNLTGVIHEARPDGAGGWRESRRWNLNLPVDAPKPRLGTVIPRSKGGFVVAAGTEVFMLDDAGKKTPFVHLDEDPSRVRFNDAKCDSLGRLWAGTISTDFVSKRGALYRIDGDGTVTVMLKNVTVSNGLGWSPDGSTFYYIDSPTCKVDAFDFDVTRGAISKRRTLVTIERGSPDGMTVDREGCLWVAVIGVGEVLSYAPDGTLLARVAISHPSPTSCAFGGIDGGDLFITSASIRLPDLLLTFGITKETLEESSTALEGGGLFVCRPGSTGAPATPFAG